MRKILFVMLSLLCFGLAGVAQTQSASDEKNLLGTWTGTWSGGSSGAFELTITKDAEGKLGGSVTPKAESGETYTAPFTAVTFANGKATMKMTHPSGEVEVTLEATLEGSTLKGTYSVRVKADGSEVDTGTITANKKS